MAGCPFYHNSLLTNVKEVVYNLIANTRLSLKVVHMKSQEQVLAFLMVFGSITHNLVFRFSQVKGTAAIFSSSRISPTSTQSPWGWVGGDWVGV